MLEKEYEYYISNKDSLLKKYKKKYIVIKSDSVIGEYSTREEAYSETIKKHELGTFLIQYITDNPADLIQRFTSRVYV